MKLIETEKSIGKTYTAPEDILSIIGSVIKNIKIIDSDTIGITLNKNIITYNEGHMVTINKGLNVRVAQAIHENPNIDISKVMTEPKELPNMVEKANEEAQKIFLEQLRAQGVVINDDGTYDLSNTVYNKCHQ